MNLIQIWTACHSECVAFDFSPRTRLRVTGRDRVKFLHGLCTNDVKGLAVGYLTEAFCTNVKGRILGHVTIGIDQDSIWLESTPQTAPALLAHFNKYLITEDVELADVSLDTWSVCVTGERAAAKLATVYEPVGEGPAVSALDVHQFAVFARGDAASGPQTVQIARVGWFGSLPAFLLTAQRLPTEGTPSLANNLASVGIPVASAELWDALRIEQGLPEFGADLTEENLAQEASRTAQCISFKKGCYLGQEPIARIDAMGHVNKQLVKLQWTGDLLASTPLVLAASPTAPDGSASSIGNITSSANIPGGSLSVGLGYVRSKVLAAGEPIAAMHAGDPIAVSVVP